MLVALQGVRIGEFRIELGGASEAFQGLVMVALEGKGVADRTPGLRRVAIYFDDLVRKERKIDVILEVPERGRVHLDVFQTGWGQLFNTSKSHFGAIASALLLLPGAHV